MIFANYFVKSSNNSKVVNNAVLMYVLLHDEYVAFKKKSVIKENDLSH